MKVQTPLCPVFEVSTSGLVKCKVCETFTGAVHSIRRSHVSGHLGTKKHKRCLQASRTFVDNIAVNIVAAPIKKQPELSISVDPTSPTDDLCLLLPHSMSLQADGPPDAVGCPLADLGGDSLPDHTYEFTDYFEEMQSQMEEGKPFIPCSLHPDDELCAGADRSTVDVSDNEDGPLDVLASEIEGMSVNIVVQGPC